MIELKTNNCALVCILLGFTVSLPSCITSEAATDEGPPPDAKQILLSYKKQLFKDPDSIKDAEIGYTKSNWLGWRVCFKSNGKNSFGAYVGQQTFAVQIYKNGAPPLLQEPTIYDCNREVYSPFPEIEGGYVAPMIYPVEKNTPKKKQAAKQKSAGPPKQLAPQ